MIQTHHTPDAPIKDCSQSKQGCPKQERGLGDLVERVAKPIAHWLNRQAPKVIRFGKWLDQIGRPGSTCGCTQRKSKLNNIDLAELGLEFPQQSGNGSI